MRKAIKTLPFFLVLLAVTVLPLRARSINIATQGQDQPSQVAPSQAPDEQSENVVKGQLVGLDPDKNMVTIRLADSQEVQFAFDDDTRLVGTQDSVQGISDGKPTMVAVHYRQDDSGQKTATIIEILP